MNKSVKNYFFQTLYQVLLAITPLITAPHVSRALGTDGIGLYSYTCNFANYFLMFSMLGMANYGARYIAKNRSNRNSLSYSFWSIYFCQLTCTISMLALYALYLIFLCDIDLTVSILQSLLIFSGFFDICWFFRGVEDFETIIKRNVVVKIIIVISILTFVKTQNDVFKYAIIMSGGICLSQLLIFTQIKKYVDFILPKWKDVVLHLRPNILLFLPEITSSIYNSMDKLMVGRMSTMNELGLYENAEKLTGIPTSLITSLGIVLLPRITNLLSKGEKKQADRIFDISFIYVMFLGVGLAYGLLGVSNVFVAMFFGEDFNGIKDLLPYLVPSIVLLCLVTNIRSQVLLPHGLDKSYLLSTVIAAMTNVLLNYFMITSMGAKGASIATLVSYIVLFAFQTYVARGYSDIVGNLITNSPFILFGTIMYFIINNIYYINNVYSVVLRIVIGGIFYTMISFCYMVVFRRKDTLQVLKYVKRKNK